MKKHKLSQSILTIMALAASQTIGAEAAQLPYEPRKDSPAAAGELKTIEHLDQELKQVEAGQPSVFLLWKARKLASEYYAYKQFARGDRVWLKAVNMADTLQNYLQMSVLYSAWGDEVVSSDISRAIVLKKLALTTARRAKANEQIESTSESLKALEQKQALAQSNSAKDRTTTTGLPSVRLPIGNRHCDACGRG